MTDRISAELLGESPPAGFGITPKFVSQTIFFKYDAWIAFVRYMGDQALEPWDSQIKVELLSRSPRVGVSMIGNNRPRDPPMLNKHFMWSLMAVIGWWEAQEGGAVYAETNFGVVIAGVRYGVGRVYSKLGEEEEPNVVSQPSGVETSKKKVKTRRQTLTPSPEEDPAAGTSAQGSKIVTLADGTQELTIPAMKAPSAPSNDDEIKLTATFKDDPRAPPVCAAVDFYLLLMKMVLHIAEQDPESAFQASKIYDRDLKFTFEMGANSEEAGRRGDLKAKMAVAALGAIAEMMSQEPPRKRFHEFWAKILWNGRPVGQMVMFKGRVPGGGGGP